MDVLARQTQKEEQKSMRNIRTLGENSNHGEETIEDSEETSDESITDELMN